MSKKNDKEAAGKGTKDERRVSESLNLKKRSRAFEQERDEILGHLPDAYKSMFGRIGFAKWSTMTLPVLILNPFHVPPRPVREQWLGHFRNVRVFISGCAQGSYANE